MSLLKTTLLLSLLFFPLVACSGSTQSVVNVQPPAPSLAQPCSLPSRLPHRDLTQLEVERLWSRDRAGLQSCYEKHQGLVAYLTDLQQVK